MTLKKLRVRLVVDFLNSPRFIPPSSCACRTHFKCTSENSIKILSSLIPVEDVVLTNLVADGMSPKTLVRIMDGCVRTLTYSNTREDFMNTIRAVYGAVATAFAAAFAVAFAVATALGKSARGKKSKWEGSSKTK